MFNKILIANRGEIACRIIKTAKRLGIITVAVYSTVDRNNLHVSLADEAFCIGDAKASESYLNIENIMQAARLSGAQAIHPGYGFLSENPDFAKACEKANIVFIGPTAAAMEAMASKQLAKQLLENTEVPLTPGYHGLDQSDEQLLKAAKQIGYPVLLKAASGGGGRGMRAVESASDFLEALASARRESKASFADDTMLIEKLVMSPRHIEVQIIADHHGNIVHLFERDCSIQRRHQKIIEEAPAPNLSPELRQQLTEAAITVARTIQYRNAGTVEFLLDTDNHFYFMEMNTRLQVEHPVTELVTGIDLVEWQLKIAANEPLPCTQAQIHLKGHAIECRVYAEDPNQHFLPSIGTIRLLEEPKGEGIRVDTGIIDGSEISQFYDAMIAKLNAFGQNREEAVQRLQQALKHYHIGGIKNNISFLQGIISEPAFKQANISTHYLQQHPPFLPKPDILLGLQLAAAFDYIHNAPSKGLLHDAFAWQMHLMTAWTKRYYIQAQPYELKIIPIRPNVVNIVYEDQNITLHVSQHANTLTIDNGQQSYSYLVEADPKQLVFYGEQGLIAVQYFQWDGNTPIAKTAQLTAPMPATIVAILKKKGDKIKAGERLMVLEAMKMEHTISAPRDGHIADIFYKLGEQVSEGVELAALTNEGES